MDNNIFGMRIIPERGDMLDHVQNLGTRKQYVAANFDLICLTGIAVNQWSRKIMPGSRNWTEDWRSTRLES